MSPRLDFRAQSPDLVKKLSDFSMAAHASSIEPAIQHLVNLRASQLNGCAFCVDMHTKQAVIDGERPLRLAHVAVWRESALFSTRERASLAWTEVVTQLPAQGVPDDIYDRVRTQLSEKEITDLTFLVMSINAWNRINIAFRAAPGSMDKAYGLDKANLA